MKEMKRKANSESKNSWLSNAFLCFYCQFICHMKSITIDDVNVLIVVQPLLQRYLMQALQNKDLNPSTKFPYIGAISISMFQFLAYFFQSWGYRYDYHYTVQIRSTLQGLIFHKTLQLNINSHSNVDAGQLQTFISQDSTNIGNQLGTVLNMIHIPISLILPLTLVIFDLKLTSLVAVISIIICFIPQAFISSFVAKTIKQYLSFNDQRNKITNETLQGIRVVKYSGLENFFLRRILEVRVNQEWKSFKFTLISQIVSVFTRIIPYFVNSMTIMMHVFKNGLTQEQFPLKVMPDLNFLHMMTRECRQISSYIQSTIIVLSCVKRIQTFLDLPELQRENYQSNNNNNINNNIAISIIDGQFRFTDPPEIPLTIEEKERIRNEAEKRKKQAVIEEQAKEIQKKYLLQQIEKKQKEYYKDKDQNELQDDIGISESKKEFESDDDS
ncbi:MAG: hypothetical protein EZS28_031564, partial [Streblomastix strix]